MLTHITRAHANTRTHAHKGKEGARDRRSAAREHVCKRFYPSSLDAPGRGKRGPTRAP